MKTRKLVNLSMLTALTILLGIIPNIGIIQIGALSLTILHIPVIIAGFLYGVSGGGFMGLVFGLTSWYVASTRAATPADLLFVNPLVSVLPRVIFGMLTGVLSQWLVKKNPTWWKEAVTAALSSIIHSFLVLTMVFIFGFDLFYSGGGFLNGVSAFLALLFTINVIPEALLAGFVCASLVKVLKRVEK